MIKKVMIFIIIVLSSLLIINYFYKETPETVEVILFRAISNSMYPCISTGELHYGKLISSPTELELADIVIYTDERTRELVGHELLGFNIEENKYIVKGKANINPEQIRFEDIKGVLIKENGEKFRC